jgi:hypothetical protein
MENKTNYQLLTLYRRLLADKLYKFADKVQEEIYMRMEEQQARPVLTIIRGGIA